MPEGHFDGPMTITAIAFERSPMGSSSVLLEDFKMSLGTAGGSELGSDFGANLAENTVLTPVFSGATISAADNGNGRVVFDLESPYEYTGGNLLIDFSFSSISGSMYVWSCDAGGNTILSANGTAAVTGTPYAFPPVIVIKGQ